MRTPKLLFNAYQVDSSWMRGRLAPRRAASRERATTLRASTASRTRCRERRRAPTRGGASAPPCASTRTRVHVFAVDAVHCRPRPIAPTFAVEANEACYFRNTDVPYPMRFDVREVCAPVRELAPAKPVQNTLWADVRSRYPSHLFVHPHSMTYDVDVASFA